jgi:hypothetical protein
MKIKPKEIKKTSALPIKPELKEILDIYCANNSFYRVDVVNRVFTILFNIWGGDDENFKEWLDFEIHSDKK